MRHLKTTLAVLGAVTIPPPVVNGKGKVTHLNADKVGGFDSSALRDRSYVFTKSVSTPASSFSAPISVPAGTYQFAYSAYIDITGSGNAFCMVIRNHNSEFSTLGTDQVEYASMDPGISGAGFLTVSAGDEITFNCGASQSFTTSASGPIQLMLTPSSLAGVASCPDPTGLRDVARVRRNH